MCGIVGHFTFKYEPTDRTALFSRLTRLMDRRGPDDTRIWSDNSHYTLGFCRLSILDLSPKGHQPKFTEDGRFCLIINGEIYNFQELRLELENKGYRFNSSGDAEVALYSIVEWGKSALDRFNGMFALAFYDSVEKRLLLARDHVGSKPLYYLRNKEGLVFGSQYDQIMAHPWAKGLSVNQGALSLYLRFGYIPAPYAILENTYLLEPGIWLEVDATGNFKKGSFFEFPMYQEPDLFGEQAYEAVDASLHEAVKRQMVSDVPLGCFLSGGIDSPLVASIAQSLSSNPIKAFTIGVTDSKLDESEDAAIYASQIGVEHQVQMIKFDDVNTLAIEAAKACSEPFGDYSIFPTLLVSKFASKQVKVILSGDGGDELFWGYTGRMGNAIRNASLFQMPFWQRKLRWWLLRHPIEWNLRYFKTPGEWYQSIHEHNFEGWLKELLPDIGDFPQDYHQYCYAGNQSNRTAQWVRWNEFTGHMGNGMLKVDRGSMYHSLEVRTPILDREVISTALRIDWRSCLALERGIGKLPLRLALAKRIKHQTENKRGFTVPMADWLRGPLRSLFKELVIDPGELLGLQINKQNMNKVFQEHVESKTDRSWGLWIFLSLALWEKTHFNK